MFKTRTSKYIEHNDVEYEIQSTPIDWVEPEIQEVGDKIIIGYLAHDGSPQDPLTDWDCEGAIYTSHRHSGTHSEMQNALGLDSYWGRNFDDVPDSYMVKALASALVSDATSWLEPTEAWESAIAPCVDQYAEFTIATNDWDALAEFVWHEAQYDVNEYDSMIENHVRDAAWESAMEDGAIGEEFRLSLDVYEHSGTSYSISGEGMQCRWDTSRGAAAWVATGGARDNIVVNIASALALDTTDLAELKKHEGYKQARDAALDKYCRGVLETYNAYCNGDVYGVCVEVFDRETGDQISDEACWGFFGQEYAEKEMQDRVRQGMTYLQEKEAVCS